MGGLSGLPLMTRLPPPLQAFANVKVFGVLSEKLYDLLQLVSPAHPPMTSP